MLKYADMSDSMYKRVKGRLGEVLLRLPTGSMNYGMGDELATRRRGMELRTMGMLLIYLTTLILDNQIEPIRCKTEILTPLSR
jgi:hypothetical protein